MKKTEAYYLQLKEEIVEMEAKIKVLMEIILLLTEQKDLLKSINSLLKMEIEGDFLPF